VRLRYRNAGNAATKSTASRRPRLKLRGILVQAGPKSPAVAAGGAGFDPEKLAATAARV
jgi:hypothetical protein